MGLGLTPVDNVERSHTVSDAPKIDASKCKHLGVPTLRRLEKEELPPEFRNPALMIPLDIKDEHTLWIARHLEGETRVHKGVTERVREVPGTAEHPAVDIHLYWPPESDSPRQPAAVYWTHGEASSRTRLPASGAGALRDLILGRNR